ncbi:MAG: EAL domain-containing protein [Cellvibrionaceae bacterium]|nr:EAL domain-containing protein [Cellvibrionaceae bacterium]
MLALMGLLLALLSALQYSGVSARFEKLSYDLLLPLQAPKMSDDIVIIDIDDRSINELGRWPWSRQLHAQLLDTISPAAPKAIGVDFIFSEPQNPEADRALARAIENNGDTFLIAAPVMPEANSLMAELLPLPDFAAVAAGIGHVEVELDIDGVNRKLHVYGGIGDGRWPSLALAMLQHGGDLNSNLTALQSRAQSEELSTAWLRNGRGLTPFSRADDQAKRVSYVDIIRGRANIKQLKDKYVLLGVTATGVGDRIATPLYRSHERMPGVELLAQQLNGLLQNRILQTLPQYAQWLLSMLLLGTVVLAIVLSPVRYGIWLPFIAGAFVYLVSALLLVFGRLWFEPAATVFCLLLAWPLWALWRIQTGAMAQQELQRQLESLSSFNPLTGLPNQKGLEREINRRVGQKESPALALLICHFNWSGSTSSLYDKSALKAIAERLGQIGCDKLFLAHLSGDEFALLLNERNISEARELSERVLASFNRPLAHGRDNLLLSPVIGISRWPEDGGQADEMLRYAATALFKARLDDKAAFCFYSESVGQEVDARYQLEQALVHAIERVEFELHFQPQVDVRSNGIVGAEALLRWNNPKLGLISPDSFIPVAEYSRMIGAIGDWVLKKACFELKRLRALGFTDFRMGVNISPQQFSSPNFCSRVKLIVQELGLPPSALLFEVTEKTLMHDLVLAQRVMGQLNDFGIEFAIDDFGTGYSSLSHLQKLPYQCLKIDQSFVFELGQSAGAQELTTSIIDMAARLSLDVIAEGIEEPEQEQILVKMGCHNMQGFLYSQALPIDALIELLKQRELGLAPQPEAAQESA